jgi:hypothetical protein
MFADARSLSGIYLARFRDTMLRDDVVALASRARRPQADTRIAVKRTETSPLATSTMGCRCLSRKGLTQTIGQA